MIVTKVRFLQTLYLGIDETQFVDFYIDGTNGDNGYFLESADGFEPENIISYVENFQGYEDYNVLKPENKFLSFRVKFRQGINGTYADLRDRLYTVFNTPVRITLYNENTPLCYIDGSITNTTVDLFTNEPKMEFSIQCLSNVFTGVDLIELDPPASELDPSLYFYWYLAPYTDGTAWVSPDIELTFDHTSETALTLYSGLGTPNAPFRLIYDFLDNDVINIYQINQRKVTLTRGLDTFDITGSLDSESVWPKLFPGGTNRLRVSNFSGASVYRGFVNKISYYDKYWGI